VSHRPLVFVSGLTVGDYLLWNWSLNGSHDVVALVSGLRRRAAGATAAGAAQASTAAPLEETAASTPSAGRTSGKLAA
jgi:hypothetical protein